jgi:hypothetical protein
MPNPENITPYQWPPGQSGNPKGMKPGTKHLSKWIQEMLHTPIDFKVLVDRKGNKPVYQTYSGVPIKAIVAVAIHQSMRGDKDAREWLAKHGYGTKTVLEFDDPIEKILEQYGLRDRPKKNARKAKNTKKKSNAKKIR